VVRDSILAMVNTGLKSLIEESKEHNYPIASHLVAIQNLTTACDTKFNELVDFTVERGFRDFGTEGAMREHAHMLEQPQFKIDLADVLSMRRREKDFLLREDTLYVHYFNAEWRALREKLLASKQVNQESLYHLDEYHKFFNQLVAIKKVIGLKSGSGLSSDLSLLTSQLNEAYYALGEYSKELSFANQQSARVFYIGTLTGVLLFTLFSAFWISKRLSAPIAALSNWMLNKPHPLELEVKSLKLDNAADEIKTLANTFVYLMKQREEQMKEIREKSKLLKKRNKELKKTNNELDSFLYSTAHDLRSPLSSLLGLLRLMKLENRQPELVTYFDLMKNSIHRLEDFLHQIVDYSKNKKLEIVPEKIDMHKLVTETFSNHHFMEGADRIERIIDIKEDAHFYSDKNRIQVIFNNLVSNAIRYADRSKSNSFVRIRIHVSPSEMTLDFVDNGIGIEKEHLHRIFDMFYRANIRSKGSGLGLFIFRENIHKLKGNASVESEAGVSTKFFIRIPNLVKQTENQTLELLSQN